MIALPPGMRVWVACGHTDMRKGMDGLAMLAQQALEQDPFSGSPFVFRGKRGGLVKLLWFDSQGMCLFSKRLEQGHFVSYGLCQPFWARLIDCPIGTSVFRMVSKRCGGNTWRHGAML